MSNEKNIFLVHEWLLIEKMRGERGGQRKQVYHVRSYLNRKTDELEKRYDWVRSLREIRKLQRDLPIVDAEIPIRYMKCTPMREMLAALGMAFFSGNQEAPTGVDPKHWKHNIRLAKRLLKKARLTKARWDLGKICSAIIPRRRAKGRARQILCGGAQAKWTCRTLLLFGYFVNGQKVTRRRTFCSDACKMRAARGVQ